MSSVLERSPIDASSAPEETPYLLSVEEFQRMIEAEVFDDGARVGLWEGRIYEKMARTQPHAVASINLTMRLALALPPGWCLSGENPVALGANQAPLPDFLILRGQGNDYITRRPEPADVGLVVEISLTSLKFDTGARLPAYARAGIAAYWVLDLRDNVIHVYADPIQEEGRYASVTMVKPGESFPLRLDRLFIAMIAASDLLPIH